VRLDEEPGSVAVTLEDSVASADKAWAHANPQLKTKTRIRKKRVIFLSGSPKF
jgi:hypothetical protein